MYRGHSVASKQEHIYLNRDGDGGIKTPGDGKYNLGKKSAGKSLILCCVIESGSERETLLMNTENTKPEKRYDCNLKADRCSDARKRNV